MSEDVLVEKRGAVAWITLNRPQVRNALSLAVNNRIQELVEHLEYDDDVRAVVVTGAGDKVFCAGADLKERKGVPADNAAPYISAIAGAIGGIADMRKPTIAAMNGSAYGGGLELAMACDFRVVVDTAELALTEVKLGIMPGAGGTVRLPRLVGEARAKEMILLGRKITAHKAHAIGLVNEVVPADQLHATVQGILDELAACAPLSVMQAKSSIEKTVTMELNAALDLERQLYDRTLFSEDRDEGLRAFAEGRAPVYRGR